MEPWALNPDGFPRAHQSQPQPHCQEGTWASVRTAISPTGLGPAGPQVQAAPGSYRQPRGAAAQTRDAGPPGGPRPHPIPRRQLALPAVGGGPSGGSGTSLMPSGTSTRVSLSSSSASWDPFSEEASSLPVFLQRVSLQQSNMSLQSETQTLEGRPGHAAKTSAMLP